MCGPLPDEKKRLSDRQHQCPHRGLTYGRDDHTARVLSLAGNAIGRQ
jgi:putative transposase